MDALGVVAKPEIGYRGPWDPAIHGTMWFRDDLKTSVYHSPVPEPGSAHPRGELYDVGDDPDEVRSRWDHPAYTARRDAMLLDAMDWLAHEELRARSRGEDASGDRYTGANG